MRRPQAQAEAGLKNSEYSGRGSTAGIVLTVAVAPAAPLESSNLVGRSFEPLLRRAGLPDVRFHDLRHTCATLMLSAGLSPEVAQERLGHSDVSVTMGVYSHVTHEARSGAAEAIEGLLGPTGTTKRTPPSVCPMPPPCRSSPTRSRSSIGGSSPPAGGPGYPVIARSR